MKKRSIWRNLFFFGLWLTVGAVAIALLMPSRQRATPNGAASDSTAQINADVPTLDLSSSSDNAPLPHFDVSESTTAGGAAPTSAESSNSDGPMLGAPAAPSPAASGSSYPEAWQYGASASPGAADNMGSVAPGAAAPEYPGAPAPEESGAVASDEPSTEAASSRESSVGEGDAIEEPTESESSSHPGGLGLSGVGEGGGGAGEGIGLGNIGSIGHGSATGEGCGSGRGGASAYSRTREIAVDASAKPPMPPDAVITPSDDAMSEVDRKLAALPLGNIAFNTPETIPLGETAAIELLVSMKEAEEALRQAVHGSGPVETSSALLADQMEAKVTGIGFHIEAITPERQAVSHTQETRWRWQIEPTKSDTLELDLTLSAIIKIDGEPTARTIRTFEKTILVKVPFTKRLSTAMSNNVELLTTVILLPVAGGTWRFVRKRKRRRGAPETEAEAPRQAA